MFINLDTPTTDLHIESCKVDIFSFLGCNRKISLQPSQKDIRRIALRDSLMELPEPAAPLALQHQRNMVEVST